jgi:murein DD-endopeptidase MepM/ murein hydrolase activator NlpD
VRGRGRDDDGARAGAKLAAETAALAAEIKADSERIRNRALGISGFKALRAGRKAAVGLVAAFALMVAFPPFLWPIRGRVTSGFFFRHKPDSTAPLDFEFHRGIDIAAPMGTPVRATAPGVVVDAGVSPDLGNYVRVRHLFGFDSLYGHLSRIDAKKGGLLLLPGVSAIGAVGSTGRSTGPHLHFAFMRGQAVLPPGAILFFHGIRVAIVGF